jgi:hypothetical protein
MTFRESPGVPFSGGSQSAPPMAHGANVVAVMGLIAAILGLVLSWFPVVGLLVAVAGLVLSILGRKKALEGAGGQGVATGGLVVSIIALLISLLMTACAAACGLAVHNAQSEMREQGIDMKQIIEDAKREAERQRQETVPAPSEPPADSSPR